MNSKSRTFFRRTAASGNLILILAIVMLIMTTASADVGTAFTYQGQLLDGSGPVDGACDIQFNLYDAATDGSQVGSTVTKTNVDIDDGLFTVELDFGASAFSGDPRWLELAVRCPAGSGAYDTLSPRQSLGPAPYAMYAATAGIAYDVAPDAITPAHLNGLPGNGSNGQMLASDGSGGFAWQNAAPVKQMAQDFVVASGESVSTGDVVSFFDGKVHEPRDEWGAESVFNPGTTEYVAISALSATQFVVAYRDVGGSNQGAAIIGTVDSGGNISWGAESIFNPGTSSTDIGVAALSDTEFVVTYRDGGNSNFGTAIVGTVGGGGSLSWGTPSVFNTASSFYNAVSALSDTEFVIAYVDWGNSEYGTAITGTVGSGGSLSWGAESVFNPDPTGCVAVSALSATEFVVVYADGGSSNRGTAITGTVGSGGSLSWGAESVFNPASTGCVAVSALSATEFVVAYSKWISFGYYGTAIVGAVGSGGNLRWGTESVFNAEVTGTSNYIGISALSASEFVIAYPVGAYRHGTVIVGTVGSGASLSWGAESVFNADWTEQYITVSGLPGADFVVTYQDAGNSQYGMAMVGRYRHYVGTAQAAASGGETVTVIIGGVSDVHTGLVPGEYYYLQADGSLGLTRTDLRIGMAISETGLLLDQLW